MASVEFYFDYSCPWSYFAFIRLTEAAKRTGSDILWRPIVLDRLLEQVNPGQPVSREPGDPRRAAYQAQDIEAWADYVGITMNRPDEWPADSGLAAIGAVIADQQGQVAAFSDAVFSAYFGPNRDIADPVVLAELAAVAGLERDAFEQELANPDHGESVAANTDRLFKRGGFGAPTLFVDEQMFFGNDRLPLVEFALGQRSDRKFVMPGQHG
ncbi:MAG: 2-hydroxychromene-2-carboxylate isomerase [Gammaproteobacteria bacterium]|jgi:2-hydroxychromene-2-carboxylate isomerase|nr:hypothetical protein [Chromatiales bacterium]MDP6674381.1 2-hydroxychromene-2-carboxylate isomerase [Gammaproteobacteria bacterium]